MQPTFVLDGGSLKMTYGAGFFVELSRLGVKINKFREIFGVSAGACTAAYYATDQCAEGERIFKRHLPKRFIGWHGHADMRYLERVFREIEPLAVSTLVACPRNVHIVVTNVKTLQPEAVCLNNTPDPVSLLMAGVSWIEPRSYYGSSYADGGLTAQPPLHFADRAGSTKTWLLSIYPKGHRLSPLVWKILSYRFLHNQSMRKLFVECAGKQNRILEEIERRSDLRIIRPAFPLSINWRGTDLDAVSSVFEQGCQAARDLLQDKTLEL